MPRPLSPPLVPESQEEGCLCLGSCHLKVPRARPARGLRLQAHLVHLLRPPRRPLLGLGPQRPRPLQRGLPAPELPCGCLCILPPGLARLFLSLASAFCGPAPEISLPPFPRTPAFPTPWRQARTAVVDYLGVQLGSSAKKTAVGWPPHPSIKRSYDILKPLFDTHIAGDEGQAIFGEGRWEAILATMPVTKAVLAAHAKQPALRWRCHRLGADAAAWPAAWARAAPVSTFPLLHVFCSCLAVLAPCGLPRATPSRTS